MLAERVGFEPTIPVKVYTLSKRAPSATRPSLRAVFLFYRMTKNGALSLAKRNGGSLLAHDNLLCSTNRRNRMRLTAGLLAFTFALSTVALCQAPAASSTSDNGGFTPANLDRSVDPCVDFYQFACGTWRKNSPIPSDQPAWDSFTQVYVRNQQILRDILEKQSAEDPKRSAVERQIGDFYYACMDEKSINAKGIQALKPELDRTAAIKNRDQLIERMAYIQLLTGPS